MGRGFDALHHNIVGKIERAGCKLDLQSGAANLETTRYTRRTVPSRRVPLRMRDGA
jgi:hypothetical protein